VARTEVRSAVQRGYCHQITTPKSDFYLRAACVYADYSMSVGVCPLVGWSYRGAKAVIPGLELEPADERYRLQSRPTSDIRARRRESSSHWRRRLSAHSRNMHTRSKVPAALSLLSQGRRSLPCRPSGSAWYIHLRRRLVRSWLTSCTTWPTTTRRCAGGKVRSAWTRISLRCSRSTTASCAACSVWPRHQARGAALKVRPCYRDCLRSMTR